MRSILFAVACLVAVTSTTYGFGGRQERKEARNPCLCKSEGGAVLPHERYRPFALENKIAEQPEVGAIHGTAAGLPDDSDTVYTILALPANYKTCQHCMQVKNAFDTDKDLLEVRQKTKYYIYVDGDRDFEYRWKKQMPEVGRGQAVVAMTQGRRILYREASPQVGKLGGRMKDKMCHKFCPDCNKDTDEEQPASTDERPPVQQPPPLPTPPPSDTADKPNVPVAVALLGIVGLAVWGAMFRNRP